MNAYSDLRRSESDISGEHGGAGEHGKSSDRRWAGEHGVLAKLIAALDEMISGHPNDHIQIAALLRDLVAKSLAHFREEEAVMLRCQYPKAHPHHVEHQNLIISMHEYTNAIATGHILVNAETANHVRHWFASHLKHHDHKFAFWLETDNSDG